MPPVLLLHGWGGSFATTWAANGWREALTGRELIEFDLPGHVAGASRDPTAYSDLASEAAARLPTGPIDAIGFSLGAKILIALAAGDPQRFRRLVIGGVGDNVFAPEPSGEVVAQALIDGASSHESPVVTALLAYAAGGGADRHALAAVLRRPPNPVINAPMLDTVGPMLLVNGSADRIAQPDARLRAALRRADTLTVNGIDHLSLPASPDFRAAAAAFLAA